MKSFVKRLQYSVVIMVTSLTVLSGLLAFMPQKTAAAPIGPDPLPVIVPNTFDAIPSVIDQAVVWSSIQAALSSSCSIPISTSEANIAKGAWFNGDTVTVGHHVEPSDGKLSCNNEANWFFNLLNTAGYSGDFITPAKTAFDYNDTYHSYVSRPNTRDKIGEVLAAHLFAGKMPTQTPKQVTYAILYQNFTATNACAASPAPTDPNSLALIKNTPEIYVFDEGSDSVHKVVYGYNESADKGIGLGYNVGVDIGDDQHAQCQTIAKYLGDDQWAQGMADYFEKTGNGYTSVSDTAIAAAQPELDCGTLKNPINWFLCPVVKGINQLVSALDNEVNTLLAINEVQIFGDKNHDGNYADCPDTPGTCVAYHNAWSAFRDIALGVLVIATLGMIISQALGFEILDAYTIKKVLPRLLIAIIGIALSWQIMEFFVGLTNDLGIGVRQLIYFPFSSIQAQGTLSLGGGGIALLGLLTGGAITALGIMGLLSFGGTAALALLMAFLVLIIRQMVIVILILFAPIAIACYILPNTQNVWKLWHESFTKAMFMFPVIMAFLALGRVFALVATAGGGSAINQLIAFGAYIGSYGAILFAARFAGGAMRTIGGFANDRSRGGFDRLKKYRGATMADRLKRAQGQSLWDNNSKIGKVANVGASWATDPMSNAFYAGQNIPGLKKRGRKVAGQIEHARIAQSKKLFEELNNSGYNDRAYRVLSGAHEGLEPETQDKLKALEGDLYGRAPRTVQEIDQVAHILSQSSSGTERLAATSLEASAGRLATLYQDPEMGKAGIEAAGVMGLAAHGFASSGDLTRVGNALQSSGGAGYAQSIISQAQVMGARSRPDTKAGYGVMYKDGKFVDGLSKEGGRALPLIKSLSPADLGGAKGDAILALEPTIREVLAAGSAAGATAEQVGNARAVKDQLINWAGPYSQASVDVKTSAIRIINEAGYHEELAQASRMPTPEEMAAMSRGGGDEGAAGA